MFPVGNIYGLEGELSYLRRFSVKSYLLEYLVPAARGKKLWFATTKKPSHSRPPPPFDPRDRLFSIHHTLADTRSLTRHVLTSNEKDLTNSDGAPVHSFLDLTKQNLLLRSR